MSEQNVATLVSGVDRARRRLYALLRSKDALVLSKRPASGEWSIVENVRHLIFAEQVHLGKFLPDGFAWSPVSLTQRTGKTFTVKGGVVVFRRHERQLVAEYVGPEPKEDLAEVFQAWDLIHQPIRKAVRRRVMTRNTRWSATSNIFSVTSRSLRSNWLGRVRIREPSGIACRSHTYDIAP